MGSFLLLEKMISRATRRNSEGYTWWPGWTPLINKPLLRAITVVVVITFYCHENKRVKLQRLASLPNIISILHELYWIVRGHDRFDLCEYKEMSKRSEFNVCGFV